MYRLLRTLLFLLPAESAHRLGMRALALLSGLGETCAALRRRALAPLRASKVNLSTRCAGLSFEHPIALAAGLDKDAEAVAGLFGLGFAAVEVGTLTPRPQPGNPAPRMFRIPEQGALINRLGFNNRGAKAAAERLRALPWRPAPLGVNLGKNKDTPLERALDDYLDCVDALGALGDYVVVNASSPNTPGLRQLQEPEALERLLRAVRGRLDQVAPKTPLFLKIAPDLAAEAVDAITDVAIACGIQGLIATNTTLTRPFEHALAKESGGLSGRPLRDMSTQVLRRAYSRGKGKLAFIGVGGVLDAEDVYAKLRAGASLVQLYTGFIYGGPSTVRTLLRGLAERLERDGFTSVEEAIGADLR